MRMTYFDRLPIELFYEIFSYFSCNEIFLTFYSINEYINNVIINYDCYLLDLSSEEIRKNEYDLICSIVKPKQIVGLTLGKTRFDLMNRYLTDVHGEQSLTRLRSLRLNETIPLNEIFSRWINSKIDYNNLVSFRFDHIDTRLFIKQSNSVFQNLSRLVGCSSTLFIKLSKEIPTHLTFLHMFFNSINDLNCFLHPNAHHLKSLAVGIKCERDNVDQFSSLFNNYQWTQLIQFNLNLQEINDVRWLTIKTILSPMFRLKYLTLIFGEQRSTKRQLFDGNQWKSFLSVSLPRLKTFYLKLPVFKPLDSEIETCLNTFRSSWWLKKKQWFIEYFHLQNAFITVPYFSLKVYDDCNLHSFDSMVNAELIYSNINELKLNLVKPKHLDEFLISKDEDPSRFCHVTHFSFDGQLTSDVYNKIRNNIDIRIIKHFQLSATGADLHAFAKMIGDMTNLSSLDIQYADTFHLFCLISSPVFSIRRLVLSGYEITMRKRLYPHVCRLFPNLTHLTIEYDSRRILCYLLNYFVHLEQISFHLNRHDHVPNHAWIEEHSRLMPDSFESNIFNVIYRERVFVIWINQDKNTDQFYRHKHNKCHIQ